MPNIIDHDRDAEMRQWVDGRFWRFGRDNDIVAGDKQVMLDASWCLRNEAAGQPVTDNACTLLRHWMSRCMEMLLSDEPTERVVVLKQTDGPWQSDESFTITVTRGAVAVAAGTGRGLLRGVMRLLWDMGNRKAPVFDLGTRQFDPAFELRMSNTVFCPAAQTLSDHRRQFSDDVLAGMALFGINGVFVYICLWDYADTERLPELAGQAVGQNLEDLGEFVERAARFGIDVYLHVNTPSLRGDHPVFAGHPEVRGAATPVDYLGLDRLYNLCSSSDTVLDYYDEAFRGIFERVPGLGGAIVIVGGECFMHCYTRPAPPFDGATNCPRCTDRNPRRDVAQLMNRLASAVHAVSPGARVFCWPYSAFTWSGQDTDQLELIEHLSDEVTFLSNLASGDFHPTTGASLFDYNIVQVDPSSRFARQSEALSRKRRPHYAKLECSTTPFMYSVPWLPVVMRWHRRYHLMKRHGVRGFMSQWRFFGFTGSLPEEIMAESVWFDEPAEVVLERYARREYGQFVEAMLRGWDDMSRAWDLVPWSSFLGGGRQYYAKGPLTIGPAHPFIFDVQKDYGLQRGFRRVQGASAECFPDERQWETMQAQAGPVYFSDLLYCRAVGAEQTLAGLEATAELWERGAERFASAFDGLPEQARRDVGLARIVGMHFRTAANLTRFYLVRDRMFHHGGGMTQLHRDVEQLQAILTREIELARRAVPILERDPSIGHGYCYGIQYDAQMVREKIEQCRYVRDTELPGLASGARFHLHRVFP